MVVSIRSDCCIALRMIALQAWYATEQELWEIEMGFWQNEKIEKQQAEINRLRAENEKLRSALNGVTSELEQFVHIFKGYQGMKMDNSQAALRAAAAALKETRK